MGNRKYPRTMPAEWWLGWNCPGIKSCDDCKRPIGKNDRLCVVEVQVGWFRGDDEVHAWCEQCARKRGHTPPLSRAERREKALREQYDALKRKIDAGEANENQRRQFSIVEQKLAETAEP